MTDRPDGRISGPIHYSVDEESWRLPRRISAVLARPGEHRDHLPPGVADDTLAFASSLPDPATLDLASCRRLVESERGDYAFYVAPVVDGEDDLFAIVPGVTTWRVRPFSSASDWRIHFDRNGEESGAVVAAGVVADDVSAVRIETLEGPQRPAFANGAFLYVHECAAIDPFPLRRFVFECDGAETAIDIR